MKNIYYLLLVASLFTTCKGEVTYKDEAVEVSESSEIIKKEAVCIFDGTVVRAEPQKDGAYISSLSFGEKVLCLGVEVIDSVDKNRGYYKVELSDGLVAWVQSYGVIVEATQAAIVDETSIYKRPDLATKTDKHFYPMELVAITKVKEEWIAVIGADKKKLGWIKASAVSEIAEDVATSTLAYKDLLKDGEIDVMRIQDFLDELPYTNTIFKPLLEGMLETEVESAIEAAIEEYEGVGEGTL
jgi:hypothetical protein